MIRILRDFKPILDLDLYSEHRITGSKIDLDLSARSTYTPIYTISENQSSLQSGTLGEMLENEGVTISLDPCNSNLFMMLWYMILSNSLCYSKYQQNHFITHVKNTNNTLPSKVTHLDHGDSIAM